MGTQPAASVSGETRQYPRGLLNAVVVLAVITAILHLYIGFAVYGLPLGTRLILIALVFLGGAGMVAANYRRTLWLKIGLGWIALVIILWAKSAAVNAPNTRTLIAYVDKAIEVVLVGLVVRIRKQP